MSAYKEISSIICFVAAHSGGHIIPCLTLAEKIKKDGYAGECARPSLDTFCCAKHSGCTDPVRPECSRSERIEGSNRTGMHRTDARSNKKCHILFISSSSPLDTKIVSQSNVVDTLITLPLTTLPYRKPWLWPHAICSYALACWTSFKTLKRHRPAKVITTGGSIAIPVCLAAWLLRIPIELFELNVEPGKTITLLAPLATTIRIVFPETQKYFKQKCVVTEYPVRFNNHERATPEKLNFDPTRKTLLIIGGSQGSKFLNEMIKRIVKDSVRPECFCEPICEQKCIEGSPMVWVPSQGEYGVKGSTYSSHIQVIHQTGANKEQEFKEFYQQHNIPAFVFSYHHNLVPLYQLADLVITRAGAGTLAELNFFGKKTIIIPLVTATTAHQLHNARAYERMKPELFTVIEQKECTVQKMNELIKKLTI